MLYVSLAFTVHLTCFQMNVKCEGQRNNVVLKIALVMQGFDILSSVLIAARMHVQCM